MSRRLRPVLVEWRDAKTPPTGWVSAEEVDREELSPIFSVGYLVSKRGDCLRLAGTVYVKRSGVVDANLIIVIPKSCVVKVTRLRG